jgi:hypothetical protein
MLNLTLEASDPISTLVHVYYHVIKFHQETIGAFRARAGCCGRSSRLRLCQFFSCSNSDNTCSVLQENWLSTNATIFLKQIR